MEFSKLIDERWHAGMQNEIIKEGAKAMLDRADEIVENRERENAQKTNELEIGME